MALVSPATTRTGDTGIRFLALSSLVHLAVILWKCADK